METFILQGAIADYIRGIIESNLALIVGIALAIGAFNLTITFFRRSSK